MRRVLIGVTMVVVAGMTSACGSPEDATTEDFCEAIRDIPSGEPSQDEVDDYVGKLEDTGTPEGISEDARNGFETWTDVVGDIDVEDSDSEEIQEQIDKTADEDQQQELDALFEYVGRECVTADN
jgi:hypothetical protein